MAIAWRPRAVADIERIVAHISQENVVAAARIGRELVLAGDSLIMFPRRGRPGLLPGTRELLAIYPYIILYRQDQVLVTILRVWHGAQERR